MTLLRSSSGALFRSSSGKLVSGVCKPTYCPRACCYGSTCVDGVCPAECTGGGGISTPLGTTCADNPCVVTPQEGACCIFNSTLFRWECAELTASQCSMAGGQFQGIGVACGDIDCNDINEPTCCDNLNPGDCYTISPGSSVLVSAEVSALARVHLCCFAGGSFVAKKLEKTVTHMAQHAFNSSAQSNCGPVSGFATETCGAWVDLGEGDHPLVNCGYSAGGPACNNPGTFRARLCLRPSAPSAAQGDGSGYVDLRVEIQDTSGCINNGNPNSPFAPYTRSTTCTSASLDQAIDCSMAFCGGVQICGNDYTGLVTDINAGAGNRETCGPPARGIQRTSLLRSGGGCYSGCGGGFGGGFAL